MSTLKYKKPFWTTTTAIFVCVLVIGAFMFGYRESSKSEVNIQAKPTVNNETIIKLDSEKVLTLINEFREKNKLKVLTTSNELCGVTKEIVDSLAKDRFLAYREKKVETTINEIFNKYPSMKPFTSVYFFSVQPGLGGDYIAWSKIKPWDWWRPQYILDVQTYVNSIIKDNPEQLLVKTASKICFDSFINKDGDMYFILYGN